MNKIAALTQLLHMNYFSLFGTDPHFNINTQQIKQQYLHLQQQYHPDNAITDDSSLKQQVIAVSARINDAYNTLTSPLKRAMLLLELAGHTLDLAQDTSLTPQFLVEQMDLHEKIDEARNTNNVVALESIENELKDNMTTLQHKINTAFNQDNYLEIKELVKQLAFYTKLEQMVSEIIFSHT